MKIVILERDSVGFDVDVSCFEEFGTVESYDTTETAEEAKERVKDADVILVNKIKINENVLESAPNVRLICEMATGYDNIDLAYCSSRGITVCNVKDYSTSMVAQHTLTLALALSQKLSYYDEYVKSGKYSGQHSFSHFSEAFSELDGKTWGIIGMGNIGRRVAKIAEAFGCRVIFHSLTGNSKVTDYEQVDRETLLAESDILSLHCPLSPLSKYFIDAEALSLMKKSAILINVARGPVVKTEDLAEALKAGTIAAAGVDVLEAEPMLPDNPLGEIKDSTKLIITPHLAWASVEARTRLVNGVYENIKAFLQGEKRNVVN